MDNEDNNSQAASTPVSSVKKLLIGWALNILLLILLIVLQNPNDGGPVVVMSFLLLLFGLYFMFCVVTLRVIDQYISRVRFSWQRILYTATAISSGLIFLTGLKTLRQLQLVDVLLVVVFEVVLNFYLLRRF